MGNYGHDIGCLHPAYPCKCEELEEKLVIAQQDHEAEVKENDRLLKELNGIRARLKDAEEGLTLAHMYGAEKMKDRVKELEEKLTVAVEALELISKTDKFDGVDEPHAYQTADAALDKIKTPNKG